MSTHALRQHYLEQVVGWIQAYIREGHDVRVRTWHGTTDEANEVTFVVEDWSAFVEVMEPGCCQAVSGQDDGRPAEHPS